MPLQRPRPVSWVVRPRGSAGIWQAGRAGEGQGLLVLVYGATAPYVLVGSACRRAERSAALDRGRRCCFARGSFTPWPRPVSLAVRQRIVRRIVRGTQRLHWGAGLRFEATQLRRGLPSPSVAPGPNQAWTGPRGPFLFCVALCRSWPPRPVSLPVSRTAASPCGACGCGKWGKCLQVENGSGRLREEQARRACSSLSLPEP